MELILWIYLPLPLLLSVIESESHLIRPRTQLSVRMRRAPNTPITWLLCFFYFL